MKANEFVKKFGVEAARDFLNLPSYSIDQLMMLQSGLRCSELQRLIESHDLVESFGGVDKSKSIIDKSPSSAESYQDGYYFRESPVFEFHNGIHEQWNLTENNGEYFKKRGFNPVRIDRLGAAIADVEACQ